MNNFMTSLALCNMVRQFNPTAQHRTIMHAVRRSYKVNVCQTAPMSDVQRPLLMSDVQRPLLMSDVQRPLLVEKQTMVFPQDTIYVELDLESNDDYVYEVKFIDVYEREQPMYLLTQSQAIELASHYKRFHRELIRNIIAERDRLVEENKRLLQERTQLLEQQNAKLLQDKTIIEYRYNNLLNVEGTFTTKHIAKELGMSAIRLNKILCEKRIQYRESGAYVLYQKYADKGYAVYRLAHYEHKSGERDTTHYLVWTNKGRDFLLNSVFLKENTLF